MKKNNNKLKILHLVRWYPNRFNPMLGLFIQRHVEAAALYADVGVVYTHLLENSISEKTFIVDFDSVGSIQTAKVYYLASKCRIMPIRKIINFHRFFKANRIGIKKVKREMNGFDLIHVHILTRLGLIALYHNIFHKKPTIITEHWSRYLELTGSFNGCLRKMITRIVVKRASAVTTVTSNLKNAMQSHGLLNSNYIVLPNVVDDIFIVHPKKVRQDSGKKVFLHVSCFEDKSKNISGLLRVVSSMAKERNDFSFRMVGDGFDFDSMKLYSQKLGLNEDIIQFTGLLEGEKLVDEMNNADLLVIFSNYENMPVVINEALSVGDPVIATRVGGIPEVITNDNGILVDVRNEEQLHKAFIKFLEGNTSFNMTQVQKQAIDKYSSKSVGKVLFNLYNESIV